MRWGAITYTRRAHLTLDASTSLTPDQAEAAVTEAVQSLNHAWEPRRGGQLRLETVAGRRSVRLGIVPVHYGAWSMLPEGPRGAPDDAWSAPVAVRSSSDGAAVRIGGLGEYWTMRPGMLTPWYLLPGIKPIWHFARYQDFVWSVAERLQALDPACAVSTAVPADTRTRAERLSAFAYRTAEAIPLAAIAVFVFAAITLSRRLGLPPAPLLAGGVLGLPFAQGARFHLARPLTPRGPRAAAERRARARSAFAIAAFTLVAMLTAAAAVALGYDLGVIVLLALVALPLIAMSGRASRP